MKNSFKNRVLDIVKNIPEGKIKSYANVAENAGSLRAYRAVATIMSNNYDKSVPCHRVIRSDGTLGKYNRGGAVEKRRILIKEGYIKKYMTEIKKMEKKEAKLSS